MLVQLLDPSPAPLRSQPKDLENWAMTVLGSWAVCIDNVSSISPWFSDALCKVVTGDGMIRRMLYSDRELTVLAFKRCVILTSIDTGLLRGDLADRLLRIELERIEDSKRISERELEMAFIAARPRILAGLMDAVAATLEQLPHVKLDRLPRMADFARVAAALDRACPHLTGGNAFALFEAHRGHMADDVIESEPFAVAVVQYVKAERKWSGSASQLREELIAALGDGPIPRKWPGEGRGVTAKLKRLGPDLRRMGIIHTPPARTDKTRTHTLEFVGEQPPDPPDAPV